jgi:hypothetical protein
MKNSNNEQQNELIIDGVQHWQCNKCGNYLPATDKFGRVESDAGWLCHDCIKKLTDEDVPLTFEDDKLASFEFGGYTFYPERNFTKKEKADDEYLTRLRIDENLKLNIKFTHKDFYAEAPKPWKDLYRCEETGRLYCPTARFLMIYE